VLNQMPVTVYHIPVCPFCQRIEILLALKGKPQAVDFRVVDITKPRPEAVLQLTRGSTALPILATERGVLKESLVILRYLDECLEPIIQRGDPYERAVENMLIALEGDFVAAGYRLVMNQDPSLRDSLHKSMLAQYRKLDDFLLWQSPERVFLFNRFGLAEAVFAPIFMRFWFLNYYEGFDLPADDLRRVQRWRDACVAHPAAQQVSREEIVKLYYDYAKGAGNGALLPGRQASSFAFEPHWRERPWPPRDKYQYSASDVELGLVRA
jgi:glutathione S-transferase